MVIMMKMCVLLCLRVCQRVCLCVCLCASVCLCVCFFKDIFNSCRCKGSQESANRFDRHNRQFHARKCSREKNLTDVVHAHLESSDPFVVSHMKFVKRKKTPPTPEMAALLVPGAEEPEDDPADSDDEWSDSDLDSDPDYDPYLDE